MTTTNLPLDPSTRHREHIQQAFERIRSVVGDAHIRTGIEDRSYYSRDVGPWTRPCSAVVYPGSREEIQAIMKIAAEYKLAVWPFSKGKNWGYGATVALDDGAVIMILERLNRILEVNEESAYAVLEPGVTYRQLNDYLKANHPSLWADCTDSTPNGSVIGNALERGVGFTAYGDHYGNLCGMEAVLPNGELVRTGGGPPNSATWNTYKWGTGPIIEGLFTQSNLGIVTQAGMWLMPAPEKFNTFVLNVNEGQDVGALFDTVRRLSLTRVIQSNVRVFNDFPFLATLMPYPYHELNPGETCLSDATLRKLRDRYRIAPWTLTGGIYGTTAQVKTTCKQLRAELNRFGSLTFLDNKRVASIQKFCGWYRRNQGRPALSWLTRFVQRFFFDSTPIEVLEALPKIYPIFQGIPTEFVISRCEYVKSRGKVGPSENIDPVRDENASGLIWFAPVLPMTREHTKRIIEIGTSECKKFGFEFSVSFLMLSPRAIVALMSIFYERGNKEEAARAEALYDALSQRSLEHGYQEYRTSIKNMLRLGVDAGYQRVVNSLKTCLDPEQVLSPGKYGVTNS
jgi:4-cresol dehydrogenase (hydroxylating)